MFYAIEIFTLLDITDLVRVGNLYVALLVTIAACYA